MHTETRKDRQTFFEFNANIEFDHLLTSRVGHSPVCMLKVPFKHSPVCMLKVPGLYSLSVTAGHGQGSLNGGKKWPRYRPRQRLAAALRL
jgi:hypothetical protein